MHQDRRASSAGEVGELVAEVALEDLVGSGLGDLVDELDQSWHLVAGELLPSEGIDGGPIEVMPGVTNSTATAPSTCRSRSSR